jgi:hypothetical protein
MTHLPDLVFLIFRLASNSGLNICDCFDEMAEYRNSAQQITINSLHTVTPACQQHVEKSFEPYRFCV